MESNFEIQKKVTVSTKAFLSDLFKSIDKYDNKKEIADRISRTVISHIKGLTSNNYKIIVETLFKENRDQGINVSTRLLLNKRTDFYFFENYFHENLHCFVIVYVIYIYPIHTGD